MHTRTHSYARMHTHIQRALARTQRLCLHMYTNARTDTHPHARIRTCVHTRIRLMRTNSYTETLSHTYTNTLRIFNYVTLRK